MPELDPKGTLHTADAQSEEQIVQRIVELLNEKGYEYERDVRPIICWKYKVESSRELTLEQKIEVKNALEAGTFEQWGFTYRDTVLSQEVDIVKQIEQLKNVPPPVKQKTEEPPVTGEKAAPESEKKSKISVKLPKTAAKKDEPAPETEEKAAATELEKAAPASEKKSKISVKLSKTAAKKDEPAPATEEKAAVTEPEKPAQDTEKSKIALSSGPMIKPASSKKDDAKKDKKLIASSSIKLEALKKSDSEKETVSKGEIPSSTTDAQPAAAAQPSVTQQPAVPASASAETLAVETPAVQEPAAKPATDEKVLIARRKKEILTTHTDSDQSPVGMDIEEAKRIVKERFSEGIVSKHTVGYSILLTLSLVFFAVSVYINYLLIANKDLPGWVKFICNFFN